MNPKSHDVTYAPFVRGDFEDIARLVCETWCSEYANPDAALLTGRLSTAHYLAESAWGRVARDADGGLLGFIFINGGNETGSWARREVANSLAADQAYWAALEAELWDEATADPALAKEVQLELGGIFEERELGAEFAATDAPEAAVEFKLLIVAPGARGLGVGRALLSAAAEQARAAGSEGYFLLTDDDCDFAFYDHLGLTRAMERTSNVPWPGSTPGEDFHIYVYARRF